MGDDSKIEWTDATWNPVVGCRRVSEGCRNCYAETVAAGNVRRLRGVVEKTGSVKAANTLAAYEQAVRMDADGAPRPLWSGRAIERPDVLGQPLRWQRPRRIFVNSMSDLFHEDVSFEFIAAVFGVMAAAAPHTFQVLTKRPERMLAWLRWVARPQDGSESVWQGWRSFPLAYCVRQALIVRGLSSEQYAGDHCLRVERATTWPLPNVHIGVSVEDQKAADERIPLLLQCPAAVRWVSAEPLLGSLSVGPYLDGTAWYTGIHGGLTPSIDWIVVGGESGSGARPMHPEWVLDIRDQCQRADVPFFFKQWGEWYPAGGTGYPPFTDEVDAPHTWVDGDDGSQQPSGCEPDACMLRIGKKRAGRLLDGVEHNDGPPESDA